MELSNYGNDKCYYTIKTPYYGDTLLIIEIYDYPDEEYRYGVHQTLPLKKSHYRLDWTAKGYAYRFSHVK